MLALKLLLNLKVNFTIEVFFFTLKVQLNGRITKFSFEFLTAY